ncbi:hypothetical protein SAMN02799634_101252 [Bacillus sp. UNCCL13]|nr:hypothetical protein SAMN02799634_101252 [Bacillus sp. UNCCL13]
MRKGRVRDIPMRIFTKNYAKINFKELSYANGNYFYNLRCISINISFKLYKNKCSVTSCIFIKSEENDFDIIRT